MLSGGHLAVDMATGSVPALLPFLAVEFDLSYAATGFLMLTVLVSSSLLQPVFGFWSDRRGAMWLLPAGVALAGLGTGFGAVAPHYVLVVVLLFVAGIGIGAYHPEAAKFAAYASGRKRASGMSYFNIGGNAGFALGPILITPLVIWLGLAGALVAMVPAALYALVLRRALPALRRTVPRSASRREAAGEDDRRAMTLLAVVIALRGVAWFVLLTFVPLWIIANGGTEAEGGRDLALMLGAGAVGTIALGPVADRVGLRRTLLVTQVALPFLIVVFVAVGGIVGTIALMLVGVCIVGTFSVTMVLSQLYLPRHIGMASGITIGLAQGLGGVAAVALGAVADLVDLQAALYIAAAVPAVGAVFCVVLPAPATPRPSPVEPTPAAIV